MFCPSTKTKNGLLVVIFADIHYSIVVQKCKRFLSTKTHIRIRIRNLGLILIRKTVLKNSQVHATVIIKHDGTITSSVAATYPVKIASFVKF